MRVAVALLVPLLLASLAPLPTASAASWSLSAVLAVKDAGSADYLWTIPGMSDPLRLTLPIPDGATFVHARDSEDRAVESKTYFDSKTQRDLVEVLIKSKPVTITYRVAGEVDGPFVLYPAQLSATSDTPVTLSLTLPTGWSLAGFRCHKSVAGEQVECNKPSSSGVFTETGPIYASFLALQPGYRDPGPDARVAGEHVRREAIADISPTGTTWTLTTTYDTEVYSRDFEVIVPEGATLVRVTTPFGALNATPSAEGVRVRTPYPTGYGLGARSFTSEVRLPPADAHGGAFRLANLSVRAAPGDVAIVTATIPAGARYAGARLSDNASEPSPMRYEAAGPLSIGLAYLPPAAQDHVQFEAGRFVVDAPRSLEAAARATATNASALLPRVADFAFDATDARPFYVAYTDADVFAWEEGFYSNGLNTISIRASTLADVTDGAPHLMPVGVLVHEATHGLIDRELPRAPHDISFLHEGLSRLAETRTEAAFPGEVLSCKRIIKITCERHSARPGAEDVQARYRAGTTFDVAWGADNVTEAERSALYDLSGLVLHAFDERAPAGALRNALLFVERTDFSGSSARDGRILTEILLQNAPGATEQAILYPGAPAASLTAGQFHFCMGDLVAPPYEWEEDDVRAPPGGCPATGYGSRAAALPTPPPQRVTPPVDTSPPVAPPPVRISPPVTLTPDEPANDAATDTQGEVPGGVIEHTPEGENAQTPFPGIAALVAVLALVALARSLRDDP